MAGLPAVVPINRDVGRPMRIRTSNKGFGDLGDAISLWAYDQCHILTKISQSYSGDYLWIYPP